MLGVVTGEGVQGRGEGVQGRGFAWGSGDGLGGCGSEVVWFRTGGPRTVGPTSMGIPFLWKGSGTYSQHGHQPGWPRCCVGGSIRSDRSEIL